jgi:hypothetical protein
MGAHHFFIFESLKAGAPGTGPIISPTLHFIIRFQPFEGPRSRPTHNLVTAFTYKPQPLSALLLRVRRGILDEAPCRSRLFFFVG